MSKNLRRVGIVGLGNVGLTTAYALLVSKSVDELVLVSRSLDKAEAEKLDLEHGTTLLSNAKILTCDDYSSLKGSDVVIITAGAAQKPGQTRLELLSQNWQIVKEVLGHVRRYAPQAVILMVTNPVDVLTYAAHQAFEWAPGQLFGTGTLLDTARLRFHLSEFLEINPQSIHAYILGEHGDSSFAAIHHATVGGQPLSSLSGFSSARLEEAVQKVRQAAYQIIQAKGATFYGIGVVVTKVVQTILSNQRSILPLSTVVNEYYGVKDVALSVPCVVGVNGISQRLHIQLSVSEQKALHRSAEVLKEAILHLAI
jgi:L-lactate dehydrogenase